jgi:hypothetical protein
MRHEARGTRLSAAGRLVRGGSAPCQRLRVVREAAGRCLLVDLAGLTQIA